jgi:Tfp pilus assembly protein FimT
MAFFLLWMGKTLETEVCSLPLCIRRGWSASAQAGFHSTELVLVLAVLGALVATSAPFFISYYQSARLKVAAEEVAAFLNQGRQLGIRENVGICMQRGSASALHYYVGSACTGAAAASLALPESITVTASANPIAFDHLGAATPTTTYTLTNARDGQSLLVTVAVSGRVTIKAP